MSTLSPPTAATTSSDIASTQAQIAKLEATIASEQQQSGALDAEYLGAQQKLQQVQTALAATRVQLARTKAKVKTDRAHLAQDAVYAYVYDTPGNRIDPLFSDSVSTVMAREQYEESVAGNITLAVDTLNTEQAKLAQTTKLEMSQEQQASATVDQVHNLQVANQQAAAAATATLSQVKGTLAQEVVQYATEQAEAAAQYATAHPSNAASAARTATQYAGVATSLGGAGAGAAVTAANQASGVSASGSGVASGAGAAAVAAAESQLGVPYVWGGENPGHGFDCSGLTQWAWATAGVSIPRTAASQDAAIPHVSLGALEPGDLLFYFNLDGDNEIDHVVMYVGSGPFGANTIIQAPYTGATVQFAPLFTSGLVAAGRP
ncbi:MAG: NlpC/P60 family protein [Acidimicrobiales bacterium]